ncbi:carnitine 3-dehydrogenase [Bradyrhizobium centrosematis]|nr:carnitine 3-dehydrogenase [Bradyrhizobium centrosematis]MCS3778245.1 carnitine 3-dehydrogenase [Bradyrhizobium centrosematis]
MRLYDPEPGAVERVQERLERARRAFQQLTQVSLPGEGALTLVDSVADAVRGVELVQENVPERLELKQQVLSDACRAAPPDIPICSSTSQIRPTLLQAKMPRPERLLVAHPFQPVYLLPLVELCGGARTTAEAITRAAEIYRAVGMHPLVVRKEIASFIANRLQDVIWREAQWLVQDDIATVQEIDDAIRYSFALRLPMLGQILTYYVGSGETNMRAFMQKWAGWRTDSKEKRPSRESEAPEYTDAFLNKMSQQQLARESDEGMTIAEYHEKLDEGIIRVLHGLRSVDYGAGETLARWEQSLRKRV